MGLLNNVAIQWLIRRIPDWGGTITFLVSVYLALPQEHKDTIQAILTGQGGGLTVSAVLGLLAFGYAQVISFRATVKPETTVKAPDGTTVAVPTHYNTEAVEAGRTKPPKKTLWEILKGN